MNATLCRHDGRGRESEREGGRERKKERGERERGNNSNRCGESERTMDRPNTQFNKPNNIISVVVYNNVKTCDREIFPDGTIKQPTVVEAYTLCPPPPHSRTFTVLRHMRREKERTRRAYKHTYTRIRKPWKRQKQPQSPTHTNEMALWSTIHHKYH